MGLRGIHWLRMAGNSDVSMAVEIHGLKDVKVRVIQLMGLQGFAVCGSLWSAWMIDQRDEWTS